VVGNEFYTSDAVGITPVQLVRVHGHALRRTCNDYPTAGRSILEKLARAVSPRWIHAQRQIESVLRAEVFPQV